MGFEIGLIDLGGLDIDNDRILALAVDRVVEIVGPNLDHELAFDADSEAVKKS